MAQSYAMYGFCQNMADLQISNSFEYLKSFYIKFINGILM